MTVCFFLVLRLFISFQMEEEKIITWHPERKCKTILMKSPVFFFFIGALICLSNSLFEGHELTVIDDSVIASRMSA